MAGRALDAPVVGIAAAPDNDGYWTFAADGGAFNYGSEIKGWQWVQVRTFDARPM